METVGLTRQKTIPSELSKATACSILEVRIFGRCTRGDLVRIHARVAIKCQTVKGLEWKLEYRVTDKHHTVKHEIEGANT